MKKVSFFAVLESGTRSGFSQICFTIRLHTYVKNAHDLCAARASATAALSPGLHIYIYVYVKNAHVLCADRATATDPPSLGFISM